MKENELTRCLELIVKIVDDLKSLQLSSSAEHPDLSATIQDLDMKVKELCNERSNFMIENCYR